jgi:UDP:flavonoid glycosyltransferase YjiC (YdhE family)
MLPVRRFPLRALNRLSGDLMLGIWWKSFADMYKETRVSLGLSPSREMPNMKGVPSVSIYSQALLPDDSDGAAQNVVTGFAQLSAELRAKLGEGQVPADLLEWIAAGDAPVFFGFGSMPVREPKLLVEMVAEITARRGWRALIGAGWSDFDRSDLPANVHIAPAFDHDSVLPLCRAAVHHGGAGTTAAALRAGLPSLIVSCFADQPFWGWRLTQLGVGATFPFQRLSAARLDAGLQRILAPELALRAKALGARLRAAPGARNAADVIEGWLDASDSVHALI